METTAIAKRVRAPEKAVLPPTENATPGIASYAVLRGLIRETLVNGLARIEFEKVRTCWQTGAYIYEHILCHSQRAEYGRQVIKRLSGEFNVDTSELLRMVRFVKKFPIQGNCPQLPWSHYRMLITIADDQKRFEFARRDAREGWILNELRFRIRKEFNRNPDGSVKRELLPPVCLGPLEHYRIICRRNLATGEDECLLDLGFSHRLEQSLFPGFRFTPGAIVTAAPAKNGQWKLANVSQPLPAGSPEENSLLYTYRAFVERVVDGDTLKLEIRPGCGNRLSDTFRLKGIDCPELDTAEGKRAAKFVESELAGARSILVKTTPSTRREKWGRFLADVFYTMPANAAPVYLNQLLLDHGHAVRLREG